MNITNLNIYFNFSSTDSTSSSSTSSATLQRPTNAISFSNAVSNLFQSFLQQRRNGLSANNHTTESNTGEISVIIGGFEPIQSFTDSTDSSRLSFETINLNTTIFLYESPLSTTSNLNSTTADEEEEDVHQHEECTICRSPLQEHDICRQINQCQHSFHQQCLDTWFNRHTTCPICRSILSSSS